MKEKTICRGDLFYYDFGTRTGSVQSGTRPVLVIQEDDYNRNAPTIIVAAVTGVIKKRYLPSHILLGQEFGLKKPSMVLLEQLQTVNKDELRDYIGTIEDEQLLRRINITLKKTFGLWIYMEEKRENIPDPLSVQSEARSKALGGDTNLEPFTEQLGELVIASAVEFLRKRHGEQRVIELYKTMDGDTSLENAYAKIFGVTIKSAFEDWKEDITSRLGS